ncbi:MAG TPA: helix-turn-helix transcriptional regulator [Bdellovibrionota bacterium]|jgi:DNA-binding XRE family transcriptional regulator
MRIEGKVWKDGKFWVAALPVLEFSTQALKASEVEMMMVDAVRTAMDDSRLQVKFLKASQDVWVLEFEEAKDFVVFFLKQLRLQQGLSIEEVARRLGFRSRASYFQYEVGRREPSIGQFESIVKAMSQDAWKALKVAA